MINLIFQYLKKLNRQERVIEEVKVVLKPSYQKREITKDEYKEIMRKAVPKVNVVAALRLIYLTSNYLQIVKNKSGEINPRKIQSLVEGYIKKVRHARKKSSNGSGSSSSRNGEKPSFVLPIV